jgi:hypothetical protein
MSSANPDGTPNAKRKVILLTVCMVMSYGIIHDQITVRLCPEYFTLAHPPLFHTASPTLLALGWGVAATAGIGATFGFLLASVSQSPGPSPIPIRKLLTLLLRLLGTVAAAAALSGCIGYEVSRSALISLPSVWSRLVPASRHDQFMAVWFAHCASYLVGVSAGVMLVFSIWNQRQRPRILSAWPQNGLSIARALVLLFVLCAVVWLRFWNQRPQ